MSDYIPIDCSFHDELLALATRRTECAIIYRDASGEEHHAHARIADVYSQGSEEFMRLESGEVIRLDRLIEVGGRRLPGISCD